MGTVVFPIRASERTGVPGDDNVSDTTECGVFAWSLNVRKHGSRRRETGGRNSRRSTNEQRCTTVSKEVNATAVAIAWYPAHHIKGLAEKSTRQERGQIDRNTAPQGRAHPAKTEQPRTLAVRTTRRGPAQASVGHNQSKQHHAAAKSAVEYRHTRRRGPASATTPGSAATQPQHEQSVPTSNVTTATQARREHRHGTHVHTSLQLRPPITAPLPPSRNDPPLPQSTNRPNDQPPADHNTRPRGRGKMPSPAALDVLAHALGIALV